MLKKIILLLSIIYSGLIYADKNVLIVVTNHETLGDTGKKTGYYLPEVTHPYYKFKDAGFDVTFASPNGGYAPMDPKSLDLKDPYNKKFYENKKLMNKLKTTVSLKNVDADKFDAIVFAGGHGTMWDFPNSESLNLLTAKIYEKGGIVAALCHGPAALINVKLKNGEYLIRNKKTTGFTNEEEEIVKLTKEMPFLLETKLKERGATFNGASPWAENVVVDNRLITGQNPASASKLGEEVVKLLNNNK